MCAHAGMADGQEKRYERKEFTFGESHGIVISDASEAEATRCNGRQRLHRRILRLHSPHQNPIAVMMIAAS